MYEVSTIYFKLVRSFSQESLITPHSQIHSWSTRYSTPCVNLQCCIPFYFIWQGLARTTESELKCELRPSGIFDLMHFIMGHNVFIIYHFAYCEKLVLAIPKPGQPHRVLYSPVPWHRLTSSLVALHILFLKYLTLTYSQSSIASYEFTT